MKLKRCPFCNSHDLHFDCSQVVTWVHCYSCGATGPHANRAYMAGQFWNGRHAHTNPAALVANRKSNHHEMKEVFVT